MPPPCIPQGYLVIYSAKDQQLHAFSVNGELLVSLRLRLWDPLRGGRSAVRALLMTQSCTPGVVVVVEDGGFAVRRSHDLSLCCAMRDAGATITSAALHEAGVTHRDVKPESEPRRA